MNKHIVLLLAFTLGFGVNVASAQLGPDNSFITITNNTTKDIAEIRVKVRLANDEKYANGSLRISNLAAGDSYGVDVFDATKHIRSETEQDEQDEPRKDGETKGKIIGTRFIADDFTDVITQHVVDIIVSEIGVVKIKGSGEDLKFRKKFAWKEKEGKPAQELSRASEYEIVEGDGEIIVVAK